MTGNRTKYLCFLTVAAACALSLWHPVRAQVDADLSAGGAVRVGTSTTTCGSSYTGAIRYNSGTNSLQYCNSSAWTNMNISALGIQNLTDAKADYVTDSNISFGSGAGNALATGGQFNMFMGESAGAANTTADQNNAVGYQALKATITNSQNGAFGYLSMTANTDANNWAFGRQSMAANTTGGANVAVGYQALMTNIGSDYNVALGYSALTASTTAQNLAIGSQAAFSAIGAGTVAVGTKALNLATGAGNIALGYQAGDNITSGTNNIIIGYDIDAPSATGSNQLNIGNLIFATSVNGTGTTVSTGNVGIGLTNPASMFVVQSPAAETITAGAVITADACGSVKKITSAGAVSTNATNAFTSPTSGYDGCCMEVFNSGANNITLKRSAKFKASGGADVVLAAGNLTRVCSNGTNWYQAVALMAPS